MRYTVDESAVEVKPDEVTIVEAKPTAAASKTATNKDNAEEAAQQITGSKETKSEGLKNAAGTELVSAAKDIAPERRQG